MESQTYVGLYDDQGKVVPVFDLNVIFFPVW